VPRYGNLEIAVGNGQQDTMSLTKLKSGMDIVLYEGFDNQNFEDFTIRYRATTRSKSGDLDQIQVVLADKFRGLDTPIQHTLYKGTGNLEGGPDLRGRPKPITLGEVLNVPPVLVDPNGGSPILQVNDGPTLQGIFIYENGVPMGYSGDVATLGLSSIYDWTPVAGQYIAWISQGLVRLGSSPSGIITADVSGPTDFPTVIPTIVHIGERAGLTYPDDFAFSTELTTIPNWRIGRYIVDGSTTTCAAILSEICRSIMGFWYFTADGKLNVRQFGPAGGIPNVAHPITNRDVLSFRLLQEPTIYWRIKVGYRECYTVQKLGDMDALATDARKALIAQLFRYIEPF
jgi:hypothetical protein